MSVRNRKTASKMPSGSAIASVAATSDAVSTASLSGRASPPVVAEHRRGTRRIQRRACRGDSAVLGPPTPARPL